MKQRVRHHHRRRSGGRSLILALAAVVAPVCSGASQAHAKVIYIDVSIKLIVEQGSGTRPIGPDDVHELTDPELHAMVDGMNALMETYYRGYRFRLADPITEIGNGLFTENPSEFYDVDFLDPNDSPDKGELERRARIEGMADYHWNPTAINVYVNNGTSGGVCSFATQWIRGCIRVDVGDVEQIVVVGGGSVTSASLVLHEIGHFFDLCHTQGCFCGCCDPDGSGECSTSPGDDCVPDTLPDLACWNRDDIAGAEFGVLRYDDLRTSEQQQVDDAYLNIMSYHASSCGQGAPATRMTEEQLDLFTSTATDFRSFVVSGGTFFISPFLEDNPAPSGPYTDISIAVALAEQTHLGGRDIIMFEPGTYAQTLRIATPVVLRASRRGPATIGAGVHLAEAPVPQSREEVDRALLAHPAIGAGTPWEIGVVPPSTEDIQ